MKPIDQLQKQLEEHEAAAAKIKAEIERLGKAKSYGDIVFDVPFGDEYLFLCSQSSKGIGRTPNSGFTVDKTCIPKGVFLTEEAALKHARQRDAVAKLMQMEGARPFVAGDENWYIFYDHSDRATVADGYFCEQANTVYFDTLENAEKAIADKQLMADLFMLEEVE